MRVALAIAGREIRSLFLSPLAWVVLAVVQAVLAYTFLLQIEVFMQWQPRLPGMPGAPGVTAIVVAPLLQTAGIVLLLVVPVMTMRTLSDERRAGTLALLQAAPVTPGQIVAGKFLGVLAFLLCAIGLVALMACSLLAGGALDPGALAAGLLGLALMVASFAAAGLFFSSLSAQPVVSAVCAFGLLLLLWTLDWAGGTGDRAGGVIAWLSMLGHFEALLKGVFDSRDVVYYLLFIGTFLALTVRRLEADRLER